MVYVGDKIKAHCINLDSRTQRYPCYQVTITVEGSPVLRYESQDTVNRTMLPTPRIVQYKWDKIDKIWRPSVYMCAEQHQILDHMMSMMSNPAEYVERNCGKDDDNDELENS